jgi:OOP family OmpA-OmpF porin
MNLQLSQSRATAVLIELQRRKVLTTNYVAKGYGELQPIGENDTEDGREINRRIEFKLVTNNEVERDKSE